MKCKEYTFKLTSGQLEQAPATDRLKARLHRMACTHCRAFTHNDRFLTQVLKQRRHAPHP